MRRKRGAHRRASTDHLGRTYTGQAVTGELNGNWTLRVPDLGFFETVHLDRWSITC